MSRYRDSSANSASQSSGSRATSSTGDSQSRSQSSSSQGSGSGSDERMLQTRASRFSQMQRDDRDVTLQANSHYRGQPSKHAQVPYDNEDYDGSQLSENLQRGYDTSARYDPAYAPYSRSSTSRSSSGNRLPKQAYLADEQDEEDFGSAFAGQHGTQAPYQQYVPSAQQPAGISQAQAFTRSPVKRVNYAPIDGRTASTSSRRDDMSVGNESEIRRRWPSDPAELTSATPPRVPSGYSGSERSTSTGSRRAPSEESASTHTSYTRYTGGAQQGPGRTASASQSTSSYDTYNVGKPSRLSPRSILTSIGAGSLARRWEASRTSKNARRQHQDWNSRRSRKEPRRPASFSRDDRAWSRRDYGLPQGQNAHHVHSRHSSRAKDPALIAKEATDRINGKAFSADPHVTSWLKGVDPHDGNMSEPFPRSSKHGSQSAPPGHITNGQRSGVRMPSIYSQTSGRGDSMDRGRTRRHGEYCVPNVPRSPSFARNERADYAEQVRERQSRSRFPKSPWRQTNTPWYDTEFQQPLDNGYWYGQNTQLPHQYDGNTPSHLRGRTPSQAPSQVDRGYESELPEQPAHEYFPKSNNNAYHHPKPQFAGYSQQPFPNAAANLYEPYQLRSGPASSAQHHRRSLSEPHPRRSGTRSEGQWFMLHFGKKAPGASAMKSGDASASRRDTTQERSRSQSNRPKQGHSTVNFNTFNFTANLFGQTGTGSSPGRATRTRTSSRTSTARSLSPQRKQLEAPQPSDFSFPHRSRSGSPGHTGVRVRV